MRDRESLFNEYILEVRRREKDEKVQKKETVSALDPVVRQSPYIGFVFRLMLVHSKPKSTYINQNICINSTQMTTWRQTRMLMTIMYTEQLARILGVSIL